LTFVSPKGGKSPCDPASIEAFKDDEGCKKFFADDEAQKLVNETGKLSDVKAADFDAVFYPGGHGPVVDLAFDEVSFKLINDFYASGKIVSAVCHAPAVFVNVKLPDGTPFIQGKKFAGFTNEEEEQAQGAALVPFLLETELTKQGGIHEKVDAWGVKVVVDDSGKSTVLTGQNPASAGVCPFARQYGLAPSLTIHSSLASLSPRSSRSSLLKPHALPCQTCCSLIDDPLHDHLAELTSA
jgi:putative intracellular protease/amidase